MTHCKTRREAILGSAAVGLALGLGFLLGSAGRFEPMPPAFDLIAGAEARPLPMRPLPLPADEQPAAVVEREIDGLFFWPALPGMPR